MFAILMMSEKMATLGLLKIKVFWSKGYDIIISDQAELYHVTQIILWMWSFDQSLLTIALGNIYMEILFILSKMLTFLVPFTSSDVTLLQGLRKVRVMPVG